MSINSEARAIAFAKGQSRYTTGQPCKHGHMSERYTVNGGCVACASRFVLKANPVRDVLTLQLPVAPLFTDAQRIAMTNYLARCVASFHEAQGVQCPLDPAAIQLGEANGKAWTEYSK